MSGGYIRPRLGMGVHAHEGAGGDRALLHAAEPASAMQQPRSI